MGLLELIAYLGVVLRIFTISTNKNRFIKILEQNKLLYSLHQSKLNFKQKASWHNTPHTKTTI